MTQLPDHHKISSTAKMVAFWRQLSDIPYSADVAELMHAGETMDALTRTEGLSLDELKFLAPFAEARFKCLVSALRREKVTQVLELASGLSLRGLIMTREPGLTYVETDLPGILEEKRRIVETLREKYHLPPQPGLHFHAVNALHLDELEAAASVFTPGVPVAIIHEGLLMYLTHDEKRAVARNIHRLLSRFGGVWLTPDLTARDGSRLSDTEAGRKLVHVLTGVTQRDLMETAFDTTEEIQKFFGELGFTTSQSSMVDGSFEVTSLARVDLPRDVLDKFQPKLWTLRPKAVLA